MPLEIFSLPQNTLRLHSHQLWEKCKDSTSEVDAGQLSEQKDSPGCIERKIIRRKGVLDLFWLKSNVLLAIDEII